jgi:cell division septation protein DedD
LGVRGRGTAEPHERKELAEYQYAAIPERVGAERPMADMAGVGAQHAMVPAEVQAAAMANAPPQPASDFASRLTRLEEAVARLERQTMAAAAPAATAPEPATRQPARPASLRQQNQTAPAHQTAAAEHAPAAASPAAAEAKPAQAAAGGERFGVHLASYRSVGVAQQGWTKLSHSFPELLGSADHRTTEFDPGDGRGTFIRLIAGPYPDRGEATKLCRELQAKQLFCHVVSLGPA